MANNNIELHIEKLVLHGFSPNDRHRIGRAVERELARLLTDRDLPASLSQGGTFAQVDSGTFNVAPNAKAEAIGSQIAQSVYAGSTK